MKSNTFDGFGNYLSLNRVYIKVTKEWKLIFRHNPVNYLFKFIRQKLKITKYNWVFEINFSIKLTFSDTEY